MPTPVTPAVPPTVTATPAPAPQSATEPSARVALLLPLTGPNAGLGEALLNAAQLALFDNGDAAFTLLPRDTGGTPEGAAQAADAAIADGARLIVGPLFAGEAAAVAVRARAAGVNVLSLSNDRSIAGQGLYVLGLSPQGQIERVVVFARGRGFARFAALVPNNTFGAAAEEALAKVAGGGGGEVTMVERYDPAAADSSAVVRRFAAEFRRRGPLGARVLTAATDESSSREAVTPASAQGYDAILLPDFGDRLLAIAPLLAYYDVDPGRFRLLGTALWEDPRLGREPALIGSWFAAPPPAARDEIAQRYRRVYGSNMPRIATLAYDAVAVAAVLARGENGPDFSDKALTNPSGYAGLDGIFRLRPDGTNERGLAVLEVQRSGFRIVAPAPETFEKPTN
ncbi:MAG: penicillin-binding protein activator [Proteobacteria bacterium]|nr:penicillin-binding protein activator [Pseudomonadota bacterium]